MDAAFTRAEDRVTPLERMARSFNSSMVRSRREALDNRVYKIPARRKIYVVFFTRRCWWSLNASKKGSPERQHVISQFLNALHCSAV